MMKIVKEQPITAKLLADESINRYEKCYAKGEKDNRLSCDLRCHDDSSKIRFLHKIYNDTEIAYADITRLNLYEAQLFGGDVIDTKFKWGRFNRVTITGITFKKVKFNWVHYKDVEFRECYFMDCIFYNYKFKQTKFNDCRFVRTEFMWDYEDEFTRDRSNVECEFILCRFIACQNTKFELVNGKFFKCQFIDTDIYNATFMGTSFTEVEFIQNEDAKIGSIELTNFQECEMRFSKFNEFHRIMGCNFQDSKLEHVDFGNSLVENLGFLNVSLEKTYYRGVLLTIPKIKDTSFKMNYLKDQED